MENLKSSLLFLSLCFVAAACQSAKGLNLKTFHGVDQDKSYDLHVIETNFNHVRQQCLFLNAEAENNWRHQYLMYVLNDKNEVLELIQPTHLDKDSCDSQIRTIEKILQLESKVKVCARNELKKNTQEKQRQFVQFGSLGNHKITYESLTLDSICNSKKCLSNNDVWVNTCPGFVKH